MTNKHSFVCNECGKEFTRHLGPKTYEIQCPKCKGYDTELNCGNSPRSRQYYDGGY
jgi:Zn finger protein HypA/HybF involved in hydrogenase expression